MMIHNQEQVPCVLEYLDNAISNKDWSHARRGQRFQMRASTAIERIRMMQDRNVEMAARLSKQMISGVLEDIPVRYAPVEYEPKTQRIICAVLRAYPTQFAHVKKATVEVEDEKRELAIRHNDHNLIEKHFGVLFEALPGRRVIFNAGEFK